MIDRYVPYLEKEKVYNLCGIILLYAVSMYCCHWLIKLIWPIARENKAKGESQTANS